MSRVGRGMYLFAELVLWAAFAVFAWQSAMHLHVAWKAPEMWCYLAPERLEERQFKWFLAGAVYAIPAVLTLAGGIWLHVFRRKKKKAAHHADH